MKKLFSLLIVFISIKCFGQVYQVLPQYGYEMKRVNATLVLLLPSDTITNKTGVVRIGTVLYIGNGTKWTASTVSDATKLNISDTASMLTPYAKTIVVNTKVNISDTAAMLSNYAKTSAVNSAVALKVNIADTAAMLTPYLRKIDTASLSNRINLKADINSPTFTGTVGGITQSMVGLGNVTNESKATMFTNATFTGTFATAAGAIGNAALANSAVANLSGTNTGDQTTITGNAGTATALQTARTIGTTTGDATSAGSSFDGTANNTNALTLATVNSNVGSFGSATQSPTYTVNGKGLLTAAANVTITPAVGSISGLGTGVATALGVNTGSAGAVVLFNGNAGTPSALVGTNITGTASLNINGTVGATTATTGAFTTAKASTSVTTPLLIGGTTTTSPLTFKTTTGVGTTGARHIFQVGNNGATEAMTILNSANVGIGTATPDSLLTVQQGLFAKRGVRLSGLPTGVGTKALRINATGQLSMADTTGSPSLTSTQIAFGSGSNTMTSNAALTFNGTALVIEDINKGVFKVDVNPQQAYFDDNDAHDYKVGINTTSPTSNLDVVGSVTLGLQGESNIKFAGNNATFDFYGSNAGNYAKFENSDDPFFVGINTTPTVALDVLGDALISGAVQFSNYGAGTATFDASGNITSVSDERLKTNIKSYKTGLKELLQLKPIQYKWNDKSKMETEGTYAGFSAQNVKANITLGTGENKEGYLSLQDRAIMATLVNAVKELNTKVENLEKQNAKLVKKLNKKPKKVILKY